MAPSDFSGLVILETLPANARELACFGESNGLRLSALKEHTLQGEEGSKEDGSRLGHSENGMLQ